jgi:hypothetical protein
MVDFVHQGPRWAQVDRVEVEDEPPQGLDDFRVRR